VLLLSQYSLDPFSIDSHLFVFMVVSK
jgi:hypothetical protein